MTPFFASEMHQQRLINEIDRWKFTPFIAAVGAFARPGVGADCVSFVERVLVAVDAIEPITWPRYVVRGGGAKMRELLTKVLDSQSRLRRVWSGGGKPEWMIGDVAACSSGRAIHHLAIYAGQHTVWHALDGYGVCAGNVNDSLFTRHLFAVYRPVEAAA